MNELTRAMAKVLYWMGRVMMDRREVTSDVYRSLDRALNDLGMISNRLDHQDKLR